MDDLFQSHWDEFNQALLNGDQTTAEGYMADPLKAAYTETLTALIPGYTTIYNSYTRFDALEYGEDLASYLLNRTIDGENRAFFIYFIRGEDGLWRLVSL